VLSINISDKSKHALNGISVFILAPTALPNGVNRELAAHRMEKFEERQDTFLKDIQFARMTQCFSA